MLYIKRKWGDCISFGSLIWIVSLLGSLGGWDGLAGRQPPCRLRMLFIKELISCVENVCVPADLNNHTINITQTGFLWDTIETVWPIFICHFMCLMCLPRDKIQLQHSILWLQLMNIFITNYLLIILLWKISITKWSLQQSKTLTFERLKEDQFLCNFCLKQCISDLAGVFPLTSGEKQKPGAWANARITTVWSYHYVSCYPATYTSALAPKSSLGESRPRMASTISRR